MSKTRDPAIEYCRKLVKEQDYDRYLVSLCAPRQKQSHIWAVLAFNCEISKIPEIVSDSNLGLIRLQWWREEIEKLYASQETKPSHQILICLADSVQKENISKESFEILFSAREFDIKCESIDTLESFVTYIEGINVPLLEMIYQICGDKINKEIDQDVLNHLGIAYGLLKFLRAIPFIESSQSERFLPDNLKKSYTDSDVIKMIADEANRNLDIVRQYDSLPQPFKAVLRLSQMNLKQIQRAKYNSQDSRFQKQLYFKSLAIIL